jgi:hypothetical protein
MITYGGHDYHLRSDRQALNNIYIEEIAHALSQINRFNGHAKRPYSVAEHSLLCAEIAQQMDLPTHMQLAMLLHDAHEAYIGDVSSPVKTMLGYAWNELESCQEMAVRQHFGLLALFKTQHHKIEEIDLIALATERRDLLAYDPEKSRPWLVLDTPGGLIQPAAHIGLDSQQREQTHWTEWRSRFMAEFRRLEQRRHLEIQIRCDRIFETTAEGGAR